jgi:hypothetical protein
MSKKKLKREIAQLRAVYEPVSAVLRWATYQHDGNLAQDPKAVYRLFVEAFAPLAQQGEQK